MRQEPATTYKQDEHNVRQFVVGRGLKQSMLIILSLGFLCCLTVALAFADHDEDEYMRPVNNQLYKQACGICHFAYLPEMLPSGSWKLILDNHGKYFGTQATLDAESRQVVLQYLSAQSAEKSQAKRSRKIMKSIRGSLPTRITDIPYIREKHDDVSPETFRRKSIGSFSNCTACHTTAEQGIFEDDNVVIPR